MNDHDPHNPAVDQSEPLGPIAPLDDFEQHWVSRLNEPAEEDPKDTDAFVLGVLDLHAANQSAPVVGRIGKARICYVAAAAILIAALVGWNFLQNHNGSSIDDTPVAEQEQQPQPAPKEQVQPAPDDSVAPPRPSNVQLGRLIGQAQAGLTEPAASLTATISETPKTLRIDRFMEFVSQPLPKVDDLLEDTQDDTSQSRA